MIVKSTDVQNNFDKYLALASGQEIIITKNSSPVARLLGIEESLHILKYCEPSRAEGYIC